MFKTLRYSSMLKTVTLTIILNCSGDQSIETIFNEELENIKIRYTPDRTLDVFSVNIRKNNSKWVLSGETTDKIAFTRTNEIADSLFGKANVINNILLLPDSALNDSIFGIINVSVTPLREEPRHSSQMVDQAIMGSTINLLKKQNDWYLIQTDYDYVGWINKTSILITDTNGIENWENKINYRVSKLYASVFSLPYETSQPVSDIILNNMMIGKRKSNDWITVTLPDGRSGFVKEKNLKSLTNKKVQNIKKEEVLFEAYRMTGVPYLWGGNSSKANDCSGFTQTVFKTLGIQLPRDARQQALLGKKIIPDQTWKNVLPGDLLFFGKEKKVTHVGISTGEKEFIHQGGMVKTNSLDKNSPNFSYNRSKSFLFIKRISP